MESLSQMDVVGHSQAKHLAVILPRCGGGCCGVGWGWGEVLQGQPWILKRGSGSCSPAILALLSWLGEGQGDLEIQTI